MLALIASIVALSAAAALQPPPVATAASICKLEIVEHAKVDEVIDGDTVRLEDGRQVRLVGMQAPKLALGGKSFSDWPLAGDSKKALETLVQGKTIGLGYGGLEIDRNGRTLAHLYVDENGAWIQGRMISTGMARVYTWSDNRSCAAELLAHEREARSAQRGIWALPFYRVRKPTELDNEIDTFQVVEGRVVSADEVRGRVFLNFGPDYRTDFTVTIAPQDMKFFNSVGFDPRTLESKIIRVRGWVSLQNGPEIEVTHPEQIEILP
jgi:micrococcal nuclease